MKKALKTLAKELDFDTEYDYFNYLIDSHINGNFSSCKNLFFEMRKDDRKEFIYYMSEMSIQADIYNFYFNLL